MLCATDSALGTTWPSSVRWSPAASSVSGSPASLIALRQHLRLRVEEFDRALESDRRPEASTTVAASRRRRQPAQRLVQLQLEDGHRYLDILLLRT